MHKLSRGFTLLEMLVVLAIIGSSMAFTIHLKQKKIEEIKQRQTATLIAREIHGLVKFIHQEQISVIENGKGNNLKINPLYDGSLTGAKKAIYNTRATNYKMAAALQPSKFLEWQSPRSQRSYFISNSCGPESLNKTYHFEKEYLPCTYSSQLANGVLNIVRVDLVGNGDRLDIERADFIISYTPLTPRAEDKLLFDSYLKAFNKAFEDMGLSYSSAHIVARPQGSSSNAAWSLLMTGTGSKRAPVNFGEMSHYITAADSNLQQQFGIRISVNPKTDQYLRPDGTTGTDKLCWNINKSMVGPCIVAKDNNRLAIISHPSGAKDEPGMCWDSRQSKSTLCLSSVAGQGYNASEDKLLVLAAENPDGTKTIGTLMSNIILESPGRYMRSSTELTTIPLISYAAFGNTMNTDMPPLAGARYEHEYMGSLVDEAGSIVLPVQRCPTGPNNRKLYPRIAAAISSASSDVSYSLNHNVATHLQNYANPALTRRIAVNNISSDFSKVEIQVNRYDNRWVVTSTVSAYNRAHQKTFNYRNPSSVSVVITRWCSTVEVDYTRIYDHDNF